MPIKSWPFDGVELVPVPPFPVFRVPESVTAPVVALLGLKPVDPALNEVTPPPPPAACHDAVVPFDVRT